MIKFLNAELERSDSFIFHFECGDDAELANAVTQIFVQRGYKLVEGTIISGTFEKGNRTMRILFGAFSKYFKYTVNVQGGKLTLSAGTSGMSGGVIGIGQVRDETKYFSNSLKAFV